MHGVVLQAKEEALVLTVLEARVPLERQREVEGVFRAGMKNIPPEIVESFLVRDVKDPCLYRLNTVWQNRESLDAMRASGVKPKGVQMFEEVGASPVLSIHDVVVHVHH